jgi:SAM-dependent methyltransferase
VPAFSSFFLVGNQIADDIDAALTEHSIALPAQASILDFGCGCGRVIRHLKQRHGDWQVTGSDIDPEAIAWCRANLADIARFETNTLWPPLPLRANELDMIYAISVFTHLPEDMQFAWLNELKRVAKPGAILCLSIVSLAEVEGANVASDRGFLYSVGPGTSGLPAFYQTSFHSSKYVLNEWSAYFEILKISYKRVNRHQDLVICRNRP